MLRGHQLAKLPSHYGKVAVSRRPRGISRPETGGRSSRRKNPRTPPAPRRSPTIQARIVDVHVHPPPVLCRWFPPDEGKQKDRGEFIRTSSKGSVRERKERRDPQGAAPAQAPSFPRRPPFGLTNSRPRLGGPLLPGNRRTAGPSWGFPDLFDPAPLAMEATSVRSAKHSPNRNNRSFPVDEGRPVLARWPKQPPGGPPKEYANARHCLPLPSRPVEEHVPAEPVNDAADKAAVAALMAAGESFNDGYDGGVFSAPAPTTRGAREVAEANTAAYGR